MTLFRMKILLILAFILLYACAITYPPTETMKGNELLGYPAAAVPDCITKSKDDSIEIIFAVDAWPEFNNYGVEGLLKFIKDNVRKVDVPDGNRKVIVQFHVDTLGYTSNYKIIKSVNSELDEEALRISKLLKFMRPATQLGKPVNFIYTLAFDFEKLNINDRKSKK